GELWFRGPSLMEGYYGRERAEVFTVDGWYRTGDLFRVDDDGYFYFLGRRGDMIKTAGAVVLAEPDDAPDLDAVRQGLRARLSAYKVPRRFLVLGPDELPMLSTGKPDQRAIIERFDER